MGKYTILGAVLVVPALAFWLVVFFWMLTDVHWWRSFSTFFRDRYWWAVGLGGVFPVLAFFLALAGVLREGRHSMNLTALLLSALMMLMICATVLIRN